MQNKNPRLFEYWGKRKYITHQFDFLLFSLEEEFLFC